MSKQITVRTEEIVNSITHAIGIGLSVTALVLMVVQAALHGTNAGIVGASIFGASLIVLYTASTLFHSARKLRLKYYLNKFDHSAIYILIAGTYTPVTLVTLQGAWGWSIFGVIWGLAIAGVLFKLFWYKPKYRALSAWMYVGMGSVIVIAVYPLVQTMSTMGLIWLGIGMLTYTVGVLFYLWKNLPFAHGIFHLFVLGGSIAHFFATYHHILPTNLL